MSLAAASRLGRQLEEVTASQDKVHAHFALIGGLAPVAAPPKKRPALLEARPEHR
jgi:hypothetical protein